MPPPRDWEKITLFVFGTVFFVVLLAIAWLDRYPSNSSWYIYIWVLAMAAAGIAALLPGAINVNLSPAIRASGALAIAVLVFYFGKDRAVEVTIVQNLKSHLDAPQGGGIDPSSDIYVVINSKLATYSKGGNATERLDFGASDWKGAKKVSVDRGPGGVQVSYGALSQGDRIDVISTGPSGGWLISNDMVVPEGELAMRGTTFNELKARFENVPYSLVLVLLLLIGTWLWAADRDVSIAGVTQGNGKPWQWTIFVKGAPDTLSQIKCVQYELDPSFPNPSEQSAIEVARINLSRPVEPHGARSEYRRP
jgi:hypothetical protein